jgi:hypothetical protein
MNPILAVKDGDEGVAAMADRHVGEILTEWRAAERELQAAADSEKRTEIEARIASLQEEHTRAIAERQDEAHELANLAGREAEPASV